MKEKTAKLQDLSLRPGPVCIYISDCDYISDMYACFCVSMYRCCTARRTQKVPQVFRWQKEREVCRWSLGLSRNTQCMCCRCWHTHRLVTAPPATLYCSEPKKMVGSLSLCFSVSAWSLTFLSSSLFNTFAFFSPRQLFFTSLHLCCQHSQQPLSPPLLWSSTEFSSPLKTPTTAQTRRTHRVCVRVSV